MSTLRKRVEEAARAGIDGAIRELRGEVGKMVDRRFPEADDRARVLEASETWLDKVWRELEEGVRTMLDQVVGQNPQVFQATLPAEVEDKAVTQMSGAIVATVTKVAAAELQAFEKELTDLRP